ncbi:cell adhesion molecule 3-like [Erpetoichthys calabaricus]|uniref:cell adhesion molecule 3-like n=1 Tax=Erpetoichthys calabaricus TaxID=27687 RepID=UPI002233F907|nr:cell adhesion molecule 3-like [Erpetoichthys calabaricus]
MFFSSSGICVALKAFTSSSEVTALQNSDVLLPCYFTPSGDLTYISVTWTRDGLTLSWFKFGQLENQDKAMMLKSELQKYNASLLLKNVTFKDSGEYTCEVIETILEIETVRVSFKVYTPLKIFLKPSRIIADQLNTVECHVQDFYPDDPTIEWVIDSETLSQHGPVKLKTNEDNTSSAISQYHYSPSTKDVVPNISCRVKHESLKGASMEIQLPICKLNLTSKSVMKGEKWQVICEIDGCPFNNDTLRVKSRNSILNESKCSEETVCATEATFRKNNKDEEDKEELVCEMEFEGINKTITKPILFTDQGKMLLCIWRRGMGV